MKKQLSLGVLTLCMLSFGFLANAQTDETAEVTVNITLTDAISIDLGADPIVDFLYANAADYNAAQTVEKTSHFSVISNQPYDISVGAKSAFTGISATVPALDLVNISIDPATLNGGTPTAINLSTDQQTLLTGGEPTTTAVFNVNYLIADATGLLALEADTYTTTITYTATQL